MNDRLLTIALWISLLLHLGVVLLMPAPGTVEATSTIAVRFAPLEQVPVTLDAPEEIATPEPPPTVSTPPEPLEAAPEPTPVSPPPPEPEPAPELTPLPEPDFPLPAAPRPTGVETAEETPAPGETPPSEDSETPDFDPAAIEELLRRTKDQVDHRDRESRYRLIEVRERVMRALEGVHPGPSVVETDRSRYRCLVEFRVDRDGYIFDLGLRIPPGSELESEKIENAIVMLSPLPAPPTGLVTPVEFEWRVDFLD